MKDSCKPEGTFYNTRDENLTHILAQVLSLQQTESLIQKQEDRINAIFALFPNNWIVQDYIAVVNGN